VFGGVRRSVESAEAQAERQRFELEATYLTLTANVVGSAIAEASLRGRIAATQDIVRIESEQLDLMRKRYGLGAVSESDVLAQQAQLAQVRATLPPLQKELAQARNQLMTYLGRFPNQDHGGAFELASLSLPQELPVSLPARLVDQRPDVRAAEAQLHAASAQIGVAIADQLPHFALTGEIGTSSNGFTSLLTSGASLWSLGGSVAQTLFDGGALEHRKRSAVAAYDEAAALYRSAVLAGFQDVADALRAIEADAEALNADALAEKTASESLELSRRQYRLGAVDYLAVLSAEQAYETAVLQRVNAEAARYSDTAALLQALGGGWWNRADVAPDLQARPDRFAAPPFGEVRLPGRAGKDAAPGG
jgi:NodT family efflux transporter outer membrane factor (OMF) lipoprotein